MRSPSCNACSAMTNANVGAHAHTHAHAHPPPPLPAWARERVACVVCVEVGDYLVLRWMGGGSGPGASFYRGFTNPMCPREKRETAGGVEPPSHGLHPCASPLDQAVAGSIPGTGGNAIPSWSKPSRERTPPHQDDWTGPRCGLIQAHERAASVTASFPNLVLWPDHERLSARSSTRGRLRGVHKPRVLHCFVIRTH